MKRIGSTYTLTLAVDQVTADITIVKCTCPAGQGSFGSCKHLVSLCYALEDMLS